MAHDHADQAQKVLAIVQDMYTLCMPMQLVSVLLTEATWSEKFGCNMDIIATRCIETLQNGNDQQLSMIDQDLSTIRAFLKLNFIWEDLTERILESNLPINIKRKIFASELIKQHSGKPQLLEGGFSTNLSDMFCVTQTGMRTYSITIRYANALELIIGDSKNLDFILDLANQFPSHVETLLAIKKYFSIGRFTRFKKAVLRSPERTEAILALFKQTLAGHTFNVEEYLRYIESTPSTEHINNLTRLCSLYPRHVISITRLTNINRVANARAQTTQTKLDSLTKLSKTQRKKVKVDTQEVQQLRTKLKEQSKHWAVKTIGSKAQQCLLLDYVIDIAQNNKRLTRHLLDITDIILEKKSDHPLMRQLFSVAQHDEAIAILLAQFVKYEAPGFKLSVLSQLINLYYHSEILFRQVAELADRNLNSYFFLLISSGFYDQRFTADKLYTVISWMVQHPRATHKMYCQSCLINPEFRAHLSFLADVIVDCGQQLADTLDQYDSLPMNLFSYFEYLSKKHDQDKYDKNHQELHKKLPAHALAANYIKEKFDVGNIVMSGQLTNYAKRILDFAVVTNQNVYASRIIRLARTNAPLAERIVVYGHECGSVANAIRLVDFTDRPEFTPLTAAQIQALAKVENHELLSDIIFLYRHRNTISKARPLLKSIHDSPIVDGHLPGEIERAIEQILDKERSVGICSSPKQQPEQHWQALAATITATMSAHQSTVYKPETMQLALSNLLAIMVVNELIDDDGRVNLQHISNIKQHLLNGNLEQSSFTLYLKKAIDELAQNEILQEELSRLALPEKPSAKTMELIRLTLGLPHDEQITDTHFKKAVLSALLIHVRQGASVGSCAGTNRAISAKTDLLHTFQLITKMLIDNHILFSPAKFDSVDVEFMNLLNSNELNDSVSFESTARLDSIKNNDRYLWDIPGVMRLAVFLKIKPDQVEKWVATTLEDHHKQFHLASNYPISYVIPLRQLVTCLVKTAVKFCPELEKHDEKQLQTRARNAFLAVKQNPVIRVLESIMLAGDNSKVSTAHKAIVKPLRDIVNFCMVMDKNGMVYRETKRTSLWTAQCFRKIANLYGISNSEGTHSVFAEALRLLRIRANCAHVPLSYITLEELFDALFEYMAKQTKYGHFEVTRERLDDAFLIAAPVFNKKSIANFRLIVKENINSQHSCPWVQVLFSSQNTAPTLHKILHAMTSTEEQNLTAKEMLRRFIGQMQRIVEQRVGGRYNHDDGATNMGESHGRSVLIDTEKFDELNPTCIRNKEQFAQLVKNIVQQTCTEIMSEQPIDESVMRAINQFSHSELMINLANIYFNEICDGNLWEMTSGANGTLTWIYSVEADSNQKLHILPIYPRRAADVMAWIMSYGSFHRNRFKPFRYSGAIIPGHGISIMFGHSSFQPVWNEHNTEQWVQTHMFMPSRVLSGLLLNKEQMASVITACTKKFELVEQELFKAKCVDQNFDGSLSIRQFRDQLIEVIADLYGSYEKTTDIEHKVDTEIFKLFNAEQLGHLTRLHFADTNWLNVDAHQDVHFVFLVSPLTMEVEMWRCNQDGSNLQKEQHDRWICQKNWQIYSVD